MLLDAYVQFLDYPDICFKMIILMQLGNSIVHVLLLVVHAHKVSLDATSGGSRSVFRHVMFRTEVLLGCLYLRRRTRIACCF